MKTIIIVMMTFFSLSICGTDSSAQTKTKNYNSDTTMHHKKNHSKSSGKNVPQNRNKTDSLNDNLKNSKTPGRVDTAQMR